MADFLYIRSAELDLGVPGEANGSRTIAGLRIKFKVEKTSEPTPNKAEIEVYNLAESTRTIIEKKGSIADLRVGYGAESKDNIAVTGVLSRPVLERLFVGKIFRPFTSRSGGDLITKFQAGDGLEEFQDSKLDESFAPGTKTQSVFERIAGSFGLPLGNVDGVEGGSFLQGLSLSGMARDHMDDLTEKTGTEWSIQDGAIQVLPIKAATNEPAILLTSSTGLIGSPNKTKEGGVEFKSLLQPGLRPGRVVDLKSNFLIGIYVVRKVTHAGDTHGGEWLSECEAVRVG